MNQGEARKMAELARMLRSGPGDGWRETLAAPLNEKRSLDEATRSLRLWLDTWILPALDASVARYGRKRQRGK